VSLLLDTHALLWWLADDPTLSDAARTAIANEARIFVSAATVWEIAIKQNAGRLDAPSDLEEEVERNGFEPLPITLTHAYAAGFLPKHHEDPFDRMLIAQAAIEGLKLVTRDRRFTRYGVATLPA
jgi:PIN domain nuclease of toxin-antitoxin system